MIFLDCCPFDRSCLILVCVIRYLRVIGIPPLRWMCAISCPFCIDAASGRAWPAGYQATGSDACARSAVPWPPGPHLSGGANRSLPSCACVRLGSSAQVRCSQSRYNGACG